MEEALDRRIARGTKPQVRGEGPLGGGAGVPSEARRVGQLFSRIVGRGHLVLGGLPHVLNQRRRLSLDVLERVHGLVLDAAEF